MNTRDENMVRYYQPDQYSNPDTETPYEILKGQEQGWVIFRTTNLITENDVRILMPEDSEIDESKDPEIDLDSEHKMYIKHYAAQTIKKRMHNIFDLNILRIKRTFIALPFNISGSMADAEHFMLVRHINRWNGLRIHALACSDIPFTETEAKLHYINHAKKHGLNMTKTAMLTTETLNIEYIFP